MAESRSGGERRRVLSAEFKLEAVRRMEERRAGGWPNSACIWMSRSPMTGVDGGAES